jgi:hypothetical protein
VVDLNYIYRDNLDSNIDEAELFDVEGKLLSLIKRWKAKKLGKKKASKKSTLAVRNLQQLLAFT